MYMSGSSSLWQGEIHVRWFLWGDFHYLVRHHLVQDLPVMSVGLFLGALDIIVILLLSLHLEYLSKQKGFPLVNN